MNRLRAFLTIALLALGAAGTARADGPPRRVASLDQCADQYVLALVPRGAIAGLSPRADDPDSYMRAEAAGLPRVRPTAESILALRPDVVVRSWGGDPRLIRALERRGVRVVQTPDASDFDQVREGLRLTGAALGATGRAEALIARMDAKLARARGAWRGERALYLTPGGYTAGSGTLIDAVLKAAGLTNAAEAPFFAPVSLEALVARPPKRVVTGFFGDQAGGRWLPGRHPVVRRLVAERRIADLSGAWIGCPGWFAADAALAIAQAAPAR